MSWVWVFWFFFVLLPLCLLSVCLWYIFRFLYLLLMIHTVSVVCLLSRMHGAPRHFFSLHLLVDHSQTKHGLTFSRNRRSLVGSGWELVGVVSSSKWSYCPWRDSEPDQAGECERAIKSFWWLNSTVWPVKIFLNCDLFHFLTLGDLSDAQSIFS